MIRVCKCSRTPMSQAHFEVYHTGMRGKKFCGSCGGPFELEESRVKGIRVYYEGDSPGYISIDELRELLAPDLNELIADDIDDHTSLWGGPGPDCFTERRESAIITSMRRAA